MLELPGGFTIDDAILTKFPDVGSVISQALKYVFPISGLILFGIIIISGFQLLTSSGNPENIQKAQKQLTIGVVGFLIIITSYWIGQILEVLFGITIF